MESNETAKLEEINNNSQSHNENDAKKMHKERSVPQSLISDNV